MGKLLSGAEEVDELILFLMLRPLLKYNRRRAVAVEEPEVLNPSLSEPLELLPPERIPMPFNWAAARTAVGVDGFVALDVVVDVAVAVQVELAAFTVDIAAVAGVDRLAGRVMETALLLVRGEALELELDVVCLPLAGFDDFFSLDCWPSVSAIIAADRVLM